ncbi:MAG: septum site-determining protein MinD [Anaerolineales bacterium]|nr:septum site-determining protein MinD [Anaerolineales bacterium]MCB9127534.1 septum site-determining protein MinD [Ardenticatenales bacterium]
MSGQVITITSGKGGVGKTTTTANLGTALAMLDQRVAVLDADIGLRNLDLVLGLENRIVYDVVDVVEGRARLAQALVRDKRFPELHLLPAAQTRDKSAVNPRQMAQICEALRPRYDFILVDSPAGIEQGFHNAISGADRVIVVTTPELSAVRDADRIIGLLEAADKQQPSLIVNRIKPSMVKRQEMLSVEDVLDVLAIPLLGVIPDDEQIIIATNDGTPVATDSKYLSGRAYQNIARRLLGEEVPLLDLRERGFFERIFGFGR